MSRILAAFFYMTLVKSSDATSPDTDACSNSGSCPSIEDDTSFIQVNAKLTSLAETKMDAEFETGDVDGCLGTNKCTRWVVKLAADGGQDPTADNDEVKVWTHMCTHKDMVPAIAVYDKSARDEGWDRLTFKKGSWAWLGHTWVASVTSKGEPYILEHVMVVKTGAGWLTKVNQGVEQKGVLELAKNTDYTSGRSLTAWRSSAERLGGLSAEDLVNVLKSAPEGHRVFIDLHRGMHEHTGNGNGNDFGPTQNLADPQCPAARGALGKGI